MSTIQTAAETTASVDFPSDYCIRTVSHVGYDTIHNLCTGAQVSVDWGAGGWAAAVAIGLVGIFVAVIITTFAVVALQIIRDTF